MTTLTLESITDLVSLEHFLTALGHDSKAAKKFVKQVPVGECSVCGQQIILRNGCTVCNYKEAGNGKERNAV